MTEPELTPINEDEEYWYNRKTKSVDVGMLAPGPDRIGPFRTREEAERALEIVQERANAWADEDAEEDR